VKSCGSLADKAKIDVLKIKFDDCMTLPNPSIKSVADIDAIVMLYCAG
jgi:hypothetical protein